MSHESEAPKVVLKKDRRRGGDRRAMSRSGGRRAFDLDTCPADTIGRPARALMLWPDLPAFVDSDRTTIH